MRRYLLTTCLLLLSVMTLSATLDRARGEAFREQVLSVYQKGGGEGLLKYMRTRFYDDSLGITEEQWNYYMGFAYLMAYYENGRVNDHYVTKAKEYFQQIRTSPNDDLLMAKTYLRLAQIYTFELGNKTRGDYYFKKADFYTRDGDPFYYTIRFWRVRLEVLPLDKKKEYLKVLNAAPATAKLFDFETLRFTTVNSMMGTYKQQEKTRDRFGVGDELPEETALIEERPVVPEEKEKVVQLDNAKEREETESEYVKNFRHNVRELFKKESRIELVNYIEKYHYDKVPGLDSKEWFYYRGLAYLYYHREENRAEQFAIRAEESFRISAWHTDKEVRIRSLLYLGAIYMLYLDEFSQADKYFRRARALMQEGNRYYYTAIYWLLEVRTVINNMTDEEAEALVRLLEKSNTPTIDKVYDYREMEFKTLEYMTKIITGKLSNVIVPAAQALPKGTLVVVPPAKPFNAGDVTVTVIQYKKVTKGTRHEKTHVARAARMRTTPENTFVTTVVADAPAEEPMPMQEMEATFVIDDFETITDGATVEAGATVLEFGSESFFEDEAAAVVAYRTQEEESGVVSGPVPLGFEPESAFTPGASPTPTTGTPFLIDGTITTGATSSNTVATNTYTNMALTPGTNAKMPATVGDYKLIVTVKGYGSAELLFEIIEKFTTEVSITLQDASGAQTIEANIAGFEADKKQLEEDAAQAREDEKVARNAGDIDGALALINKIAEYEQQINDVNQKILAEKQKLSTLTGTIKLVRREYPIP